MVCDLKKFKKHCSAACLVIKDKDIVCVLYFEGSVTKLPNYQTAGGPRNSR